MSIIERVQALYNYMYSYALNAVPQNGLLFEFYFSKEYLWVVVDEVEERCGKLEGGTEHYGNVAHMHLVDVRLCVREMVQTRRRFIYVRRVCEK